ncbi:MAG: hypothetical protein V1754_06430, partial [Pseudomonadota bacterium]
MQNAPKALFSLILIFMALGAIGLIVSLVNGYGKEAVRDSAIWFYCAFVIVGYRFGRLPHFADVFWTRMQVVWMFAMLWTVANFLTDYKLCKMGPLVPGRGIPLLSNSGSEMYEHSYLAMVLIMMLPEKIRSLRMRKVWYWIAMVVGVLDLATAWIRAPKVAAIVATGVGVIASAGGIPTVWPASRVFGTIVLLFTLLVGGIVILEPELLAKHLHLLRFTEISPKRSGTTEFWRRIWWEMIHDAVQKENPMMGLGFGQSLGLYNPFITGDERYGPAAVRSPHNINMTVYARMGILGALCWLGILFLTFGSLYRHVRLAGNSWGHYTSERRKEITFWLMMLTATLVNSSLGVLMEGPVLGIWFWF